MIRNKRLHDCFSVSYSTIRCLLIITFLLHLHHILLSQPQNLGLPIIHSYDKEVYDAGTSNWDCDIAPNGNLLIANNSGLLIYNGISWQLETLPNKSIVRSVSASTADKIYVGGQDEIGYFEPDEMGALRFTSIRHLIPEEYLPLEDVWEIITIDSIIYFRASNKVFAYQENKEFKVSDPANPILSLNEINEKIYYTDIVNGIVAFDDDQPMALSGEQIVGTQIVSQLPFNKRSLLVLTEQNGGYTINSKEVIQLPIETSAALQEYRVNTAIAVNSGLFAIGTQFGGVIMMDYKGEIHATYNRANGLVNNDVRALMLDDFGNLWVFTSNGISKIHVANRVNVLYPDGGEQSSVFDIIYHNSELIIGTNTGLFVTKLLQEDGMYKYDKFEKVNKSDGQVWGLDRIDDKIYMSHNEGPYVYSDGVVKKIADRPGAWKFIEAGYNHVYVGTYTGVDIYTKSNGQLTYYKTLKGFSESSRIIISVRKNELWVAHPYRGIYKITHNDQYEEVIVKKYSEDAGLPSPLLNYVFDIDGVPTVTASTGVYSYDRANDIFRKNKSYNIIDADRHNVKRLLQNGYYIAEHEVGKISRNVETEKLEKEIYPELVGEFVGGFENMYELDSNTLLVCTDKGVIVYDTDTKIHNEIPVVNIQEVALIGGNQRSLYAGYGNSNGLDYKLNDEENAIRFLYSTTNHTGQALYRYRLIGLEKKWSEWTAANAKEYNNLSHGEYTFEVVTQDRQGRVSQSSTYSFVIKTPWYLTIPALIFWLILFLSILASIYLVPNKKYKEETKGLKLAMDQSDEEIERLKTKQLESEIEHKNAQLASSTLHLVQKNETINKIRSDIDSVRKKVKDPEAKKELKKIISLLSDDARLEDDWESFASHFDQVHSDFIKRIKARYPNLSRKDIKLSAYLRMSLSTKEIAPLMGISVRGVEIGRYRLRKKLGLESSVSLRGFMGAF